MHPRIGDLDRSDKPSISPLICDCWIDTAIFFFPTTALPREDWTRLRELYGTTPHHHRNYQKGYLLVGFQCPQRELLSEIGNLCRAYRGTLHRLDIGCDARHHEDYTVEEQHRFLKEHMLLMHRTAKRILEPENPDGTKGCYFNEQRAARNICMYWGLRSKLDPLNIVAHFDLRLRGYQARHFKPEALENLDPSKEVKRHIRFVEFDRTQCERTLFRSVMQEEEDLIKAQAQIADIKRFGQLDFVQRVHDEHRITLKTKNDLVTLPSALTWGAKSRQSKGLDDL